MRPGKHVIVAVLGIGVLAAGCGWQDPMARYSENAFANAVATGATERLGEHGVRLSGELDCAVGAADAHQLSVSCSGDTEDGGSVTVTGVVSDANTPDPYQSYEIRLDGRLIERQRCFPVTKCE